MELYQIRYFVALCETLNFARAAERCSVSSPSLTRAVQKLEHELGGLLIRRERRSTHLTELGRLVRPRLEELLAQAESTKQAAQRFIETDEKPLRFGILPSVGALQLAPPDLLHQQLQRRPIQLLGQSHQSVILLDHDQWSGRSREQFRLLAATPSPCAHPGPPVDSLPRNVIISTVLSIHSTHFFVENVQNFRTGSR